MAVKKISANKKWLSGGFYFESQAIADVKDLKI